MKKFTAALLGLIIALTCFFSLGGAGAFYENELNADGGDPYLPLVKNKCEAAKEVWGKSKNEDEPDNPHFHVLAPIRPFTEDGRWGNKQKREYVLDEDGNRIKDAKGRIYSMLFPLPGGMIRSF